ncbi:MAG: hypothetical protein JOZ04_03815, partial [Acidimicrobiia bacterium]|nr:hypothetical protein [Acidimicrobiia bacterium]
MIGSARRHRALKRRAAWLAIALGGAGFVFAIAGVPARATAPAAAPASLVGIFSIAPGACRPGGPPSGSYLEVDRGTAPVLNPASPCDGLDLTGASFTPLASGTQGLVTGQYQLDPVPTFDALGNSTAGAIVRPVRLLDTNLGLSTTCADEETAPTASGACPGPAPAPAARTAPALWAEPPGVGGCPRTSPGSCIYGDLSSLTMTWAGASLRTGASPRTGAPHIGTPLAVAGSPVAAAGSSSCADHTGCFDQGVTVGPDL